MHLSQKHAFFVFVTSENLNLVYKCKFLCFPVFPGTI